MMSPPIVLEGLDGSNPLGFLSLVGIASLCNGFCSTVRISWRQTGAGWRPRLEGFNGNEEEFITSLYRGLNDASNHPFELSSKFPFSRDVLREAMRRGQLDSTPERRRVADLLAGFGSDAHTDKEGAFLDTALRMVRSGDSNGQGLTAYALSIREATTLEDLRVTLFERWPYRDEGYSLRWDPLEDQRYALRWYDPGPQSNKKFSLRSVRGANALALEALALLPVQPQIRGVATTGFPKASRQPDAFIWPIWETPVPPAIIRSILSLPELSSNPVDRNRLMKRGITEVYRCERIAPNQYYKNFAPSHPV